MVEVFDPASTRVLVAAFDGTDRTENVFSII
jgi:hypothetical protein